MNTCACGAPFPRSALGSHSADVLPLDHLEASETAFLADLRSFLEALHAGQSEAWVKEHFPEPYSSDVTPDALIDDLVQEHYRSKPRRMLHCASCGRIHVEVRPESGVFRSYLPEEDVAWSPLSSEPGNVAPSKPPSPRKPWWKGSGILKHKYLFGLIVLLAAGNIAWMVWYRGLWWPGEHYAEEECEAASLSLDLIRGLRVPATRDDVVKAAKRAGQKVYLNKTEFILVGPLSIDFIDDKVVRINRMFGPRVCPE